MHIRYQVLPLLDSAKMGIKECQIERTEAVSTPRSVDHRAARDVDPSNPHASEIVESILQPGNIASIPQLCARNIVFPSSPVDIIICWVAIDEAVDGECIEGEAPIGRGELVR